MQRHSIFSFKWNLFSTTHFFGHFIITSSAHQHGGQTLYSVYQQTDYHITKWFQRLTDLTLNRKINPSSLRISDHKTQFIKESEKKRLNIKRFFKYSTSEIEGLKEQPFLTPENAYSTWEGWIRFTHNGNLWYRYWKLKSGKEWEGVSPESVQLHLWWNDEDAAPKLISLGPVVSHWIRVPWEHSWYTPCCKNHNLGALFFTK